LKQVFTTALQSYLTELDMVAARKVGRPGSIELPVKEKPAEKTAIQSKATRSTSSTRA
jgi:hypothetical protein